MTSFGVKPLLVISPHLDDGVLSCGDALSRHPGSMVVTVFAGGPRTYERMTPWDRAAGFSDGDDVVAARRLEDEQALALLGARPCWLPFQDAQYGCAGDIEAMAEALYRAIRKRDADTILAPIGLFHSDHLLAHEVSMLVAEAHRAPRWFLYADAIYRAIPGLLEERLSHLRDTGLALEPLVGDCETTDVKAAAVYAYRSQLRALAMPGHPGFDDAFRPEHYWRIRRQRDRSED